MTQRDLNGSRFDSVKTCILNTWRKSETFPVSSHCRLHSLPCCWHILHRRPDDSRV